MSSKPLEPSVPSGGNGRTPSLDEKKIPEDFSVAVEEAIDFRDKDEALKLVGYAKSAEFSEAYYRKLRRKIDFVIPPLCAAVYCTQYLDKTTLNYASIMGFPMTGQNYNTVALAFYVGFLIWVFPTMYISQQLRLGKYLGANIVLWGIVMMLHVFPTNFGGFFALRLILGMLESCVAPSLVLIISMFYKKDEQAQRMCWFYVMNGFSQIFGGFIAYGVSFDQTSKIPPWKYLYLVFGALAILCGIAVLMWMPDSPLHAHFLTEEEKIAAVERIRETQTGTENKVLKKEQVYEALLDIRSWLIVLTTMLTSIPNGGLANFSNKIIENFGYTSKQTLILSTPGGAIGMFATLLIGWYSDRIVDRMIPIVLSLIPTLTGAAMLIGLNNSSEKGALLFAIYITPFYGCYLAIVYAWNSSNTGGHTKKVTINCMTLAAFCVGNIVGTETFLPQDAPGYVPGKISILVLLSVQVFVCFWLRWINLSLNRKKSKIIAELKEANGWTDADVEKERQRHAFLDMTDRQNPYFVYTG